ncbi:Sac3p [Kluyveromyces lactis]|uniref:Nuclear mRNA export factor n=1 Tax=Kluyveromyces lactis (strain ATCC 8585 / CBS 2359 / DSM 70799 / NBRC 1267 / NRRL Y-1140 / WM37) TaxID=284590 RepID=Q6CQI8_KLULA|nr:uncharacterized protein KLLA0_D16775g [Kluyveromyces lactis]CAH00897.1 KLLA0D16775p [Kluyveromyces lactis]|eukprot:XP_453801.1 uncharacterized protein KLLA0_D16775g [Kluyveromyces lactis]
MLGSMFGGSSIPPSAAPFSMHDSSRSSSNHAEKRKFKRPNGKSSKTTSNNGSKGKLIKKMVPTLSQDQNEIIGTLFDGNPAILGFQQPTKPAERELPRYLIRQAPILKPVPIVQDEWDKKNQERMLQLEDNISDVTTLWETLKKMRDEEREVMEEKGLVDKADQAKDLTEAIIFQGTCQDMCPIFERARRSVENNVVRYEKANPSDKKVDRGKALKVFARPAAAAAPPLPSDVRPPHVLLGTLDYIVDEIVPLLPDCEAFLWDRMRSIRQDFTYQNYSGPEAIDCNERIVRIHLLILHQMAKTDITFSVQQELEQLHKAIITLCEIYDEVRDQGGQCPNEAEFRAYALLSKIRDPEYDKMAQDLPNDIFNDELMQLAITFRRILANSNHVERGVVVTENCMNLYDRFFQLIQSDKVPFLMSSFLQVYLNEIRFYAFKSLSLAVTRKGGNLPYQYFIEHFLFRDANDLETFCRYYSIDFGDGKILLKSLTGTSHFLAETQPMRKNWVSCVEQKLQRNTTTALINNRKHNVDTIPSNKRSLLDNVSQLEESQLTQYNQNFAGTSGAKETLPISANRPFSFQTSTSLITEKNATANGNQPFMFGTPSQPKTDVKKAPNDVSLEGVKLGQAAPFGKTDEFVKKQALQQKLEEQKQKFNMQKQLDEKARLLNEKQGLEKQNEEKLRRQLELEKVQQAAIQRRNEIVNETSSNIFTTLMEQQLEKTIKNEIQKRQANALHIENLSRDLFRSFIHEQIYFVFLEVRADIFKKKIITMHVMKKWRSKFNKILKLKKIKQQKQEEALRLSKELGVGKRVHSLRSTTKKNKYLDANSTFEASSFIKSGTMNYSTPLHLEENHFTTPVRNNSNVWSPLDLKEVYFNELLSRLQGILKDSKLQSKDIKSQIDIVLYSKTWECISGQWLLSKFHLAKDSTYTIDSPILNAGFIRLTNDYKTDSFNNVNLVLFNSGVTDSDIFDLDMKLQKDGERLIEVICGVAFNTNYKFKLIIIYWESIENPKSTTEIKQLLKVHKILKRFGDIMYGIEVVKIVGSNPEALVANGLANAAHDFQFELTDRGLYNETRKRRSLLGVGMDTVREPSADIDEKMQLMLQQDKDKSISSIKEKSAYAYLKNHAMASPRARYKKLPVLLSESHKPKYKTPIPLANSRHSSITSADVSNPSHLVKKIKPSRTQIPPHNTSGNFGTPSQPRSLLNHTAVLTTPHLAGIGSHNASASSNVANISVHSDFTTPSATSAPPKPMARSFSISEHPTQPDHTKSKRMPRSVPGDIPPSIKELQNLIASVKRNLQDHQ